MLVLCVSISISLCCSSVGPKPLRVSKLNAPDVWRPIPTKRFCPKNSTRASCFGAPFCVLTALIGRPSLRLVAFLLQVFPFVLKWTERGLGSFPITSLVSLVTTTYHSDEISLIHVQNPSLQNSPPAAVKGPCQAWQAVVDVDYYRTSSLCRNAAPQTKLVKRHVDTTSRSACWTLSVL